MKGGVIRALRAAVAESSLDPREYRRKTHSRCEALGPWVDRARRVVRCLGEKQLFDVYRLIECVTE